MKASDLKASLLQLAVSGKLVLQDPNDEPAGALLKRIKKEREALLKAGKIKTGKPLSPVSEEEKPFEIPASWEWVRLGNLCKIVGDGLHGTPEYDINGDYYFINGNNLDGFSIKITERTQRVNKSQYELYKKDLTPNTLLYSINGTIGNIAYYNNEKVILGKSAAYFTLLNGVLREYLAVILRSNSTRLYFKEKLTQTTIVNLPLSALRSLPFPLPPLAEQQRIVARIEELMPLIEAYDREEQKLSALEAAFPEALRQSILQYAVEGKLVPQKAEDGTAAELLAKIKKERDALIKEGKIKKGTPLAPVSEEEKPFVIPASWEWVRLGDIMQLISGRDLTPEEYTDKMCGIPYLIGASNVEDGIITVERWTEQPKVISLEHDLLLSCKGTIGKTAIQKLPQAHIARQFMSLRPYFGIDVFYFKIFIDNYVPILISQAKSMIPGISREDVLPIMCPLPPLAEQHRIVERIEELMELCDRIPLHGK